MASVFILNFETLKNIAPKHATWFFVTFLHDHEEVQQILIQDNVTLRWNASGDVHITADMLPKGAVEAIQLISD